MHNIIIMYNTGKYCNLIQIGKKEKDVTKGFESEK